MQKNVPVVRSAWQHLSNGRPFVAMRIMSLQVQHWQAQIDWHGQKA